VPQQVTESAQPYVQTPPATPTNSNIGPPTRLKLKHRFSEFTDEERERFSSDFEGKYKPAVTKWSKAFHGRIPIDPDDLTLKKFVERIGTTPSYSEYIFVVNGITLGVQENRGVVRVDYLNSPAQTRKLAVLPDGSQTPITTSPVTRQEVIEMLEASCGTKYAPTDVRIIPSGLSGSLAGGAFVNVGGNPENGASWKYDMVFGPDGKLAFYQKGNN
jgi:hypothetical protein